jgi:hypothetical protein
VARITTANARARFGLQASRSEPKASEVHKAGA